MSDTDLRLPPGAKGFAVSAELATHAYRRLSDLQDQVGQLVRQANVLGRSIPLGAGYAGEVGDFMASYGIGGAGSAADSLVKFGRELEDLKAQIEAAMRRYTDADTGAAGGLGGPGVDCTGG
ncbi:hypothetical protein B0I33_101286 [Prauserella shujinwangii]|uniref:Uncharacterized protein n=1 Tax=Prauserella shujinwangii TaxID=1453103 RepID=A0A2T0M308_9PSEU|nr:hypothetical protein [Prauserella shujinwangii]PRX51133.1 hypothetical protein B0I33_101286 [Prauserella shujinwangii]